MYILYITLNYIQCYSLQLSCVQLAYDDVMYLHVAMAWSTPSPGRLWGILQQHIPISALLSMHWTVHCLARPPVHACCILLLSNQIPHSWPRLLLDPLCPLSYFTHQLSFTAGTLFALHFCAFSLTPPPFWALMAKLPSVLLTANITLLQKSAPAIESNKLPPHCPA